MVSQVDTKSHWERVYGTKAPTEVSWFRPHLETSLALIERVASDRSASIIDVGGGESTLVDDLIDKGYLNVTVLDILRTAIEHSKKQMSSASSKAVWLIADVTNAESPARAYDVWHDRAVFHFLTEPEQRLAYVGQVAKTVKHGGHVIIGTFGPEGPVKCSGLTIRRELVTGRVWSTVSSHRKHDGPARHADRNHTSTAVSSWSESSLQQE